MCCGVELCQCSLLSYHTSVHNISRHISHTFILVLIKFFREPVIFIIILFSYFICIFTDNAQCSLHIVYTRFVESKPHFVLPKFVINRGYSVLSIIAFKLHIRVFNFNGNTLRQLFFTSMPVMGTTPFSVYKHGWTTLARAYTQDRFTLQVLFAFFLVLPWPWFFSVISVGKREAGSHYFLYVLETDYHAVSRWAHEPFSVLFFVWNRCT